MLDAILASLIATVVWAGARRLWRGWSEWSEPTEEGAQPASEPTTQQPPAPPPPATTPQPARRKVWLGRLFLVYRYPWSVSWKDTSGLYIFARQQPESDQGWEPILLRSTGSFATELSDPARWREARQRHRATHLHVHQAVPSDALRVYRERFIEEFQPVMNVEAVSAVIET